MGRADHQFAVGVGLALLSLAPGLSDGLRILLAVIGGAIIFVSAVVGLTRFFQRWFSSPAKGTEPRKTERWPNFDKWDRQHEFELYEAACLWFDQEPTLPMPDEARTLFHGWQFMIEKGEMSARFSYDALSDAIHMAMFKHGELAPGADFAPLVSVQTRVDRRVLVEWARERQQQPRFLFPERRAD